MLLTLVFILPLIVALACLALSQAVATRLLGLAAGAAILVGGIGLLSAKLRAGLPLTVADRAWLAVGSHPIRVSLAFDSLNWVPALLALLGGGVALLVLALVVPRNLRGFGGLFAAAQIAILAIVAGLANQDLLLLPFAWSLAALLMFLALRASGALSGSDGPVIVLLAGLCGGLVALGSALLMATNTPSSALAGAALGGWVVFGLLATGAPPFHAPQQRLAEAPAALAGMLLTLCQPLLGGVTLIRYVTSASSSIPRAGHVALAGLGIVTLIVCAAGATGTTKLRRLLSWQLSAQMGLVLLALGQGGTAVAAPALLVNGALSTLVGYLAVVALERRAGTDDLAAIALRERLIVPGVLFLIAAASAIGLPGLWGFWAHRWLLDDLARTMPLATAPVLAGSTLSALAFLPALAVFFRRTGGSPADKQLTAGLDRPSASILVGVIGAAPLLLFGVAPQLMWNGWLSSIPGAGATPALPSVLAQAACVVAVLLLVVIPIAILGREPASDAAPADSTGVVTTAALGESLGWLAWPATATAAFAGAWDYLLRGCRLLLRGLQLFEQRYYLAGLLIAVIVVVMLFIQ